MGAWTLEDIAWDLFNPTLVDPEMLKVIKAASLVEHNALDYERYLNNVFRKDPSFQKVIKVWTREEIQHGKALAKWAMLADPTFNFKEALKAFRQGFQIPLTSTISTRGSLSGELVARCVIETGTSSFYIALKEMSQEPVLKEICAHIAADELRHYKLFYTHLQRYLEEEGPSRFKRLKIAFERMLEAEDDELAMAYYSANEVLLKEKKVYDRVSNSKAYLDRIYGYYDKGNVRRGIAMILKAGGVSPHGALSHIFFQILWMVITLRKKRAARFSLP